MKRRDFLKTSAALIAASSSGLSWQTLAENNFATQLQQLLRTYTDQNHPAKKLRITGSWPKDIQGTLYRNGPALFTRHGDSQHHWFSGDGMVHAYRIQAGEVFHQAKYVETDKFQQEKQADQFLYSAFGKVRNADLTKNNDSLNMANTNIQKIGDKYYALWEAGSAYEINPDDLSTLGINSLSSELQHLPFSAHPIKDDNGDWWNIGSLVNNGVAQVIVYQLDPSGKLRRYQLIDLPQAGYMHAFAVSQNHIILLNTACLYQNENEDKAFVDRFAFADKGASQILLIDKNTLTLKRTIEIPANFVFHFGNAYEQKNTLFLSFAEYPNADLMLSGMGLHLPQGLGTAQYQNQWVRYAIDLNTGHYNKYSADTSLEFPQYDLADPYRSQTIIGVNAATGSSQGLSNQLLSINPNMERRQHYSYGRGIIAEEPLLVRASAGKAYIVQTFINVKNRTGGVAVFDSEGIQHGPIATALSDRPIAPGFHGSFITSG